MLLLLNEHGDPSFLFPNFSSYNINNQLAKFEKNLTVGSISVEWPSLERTMVDWFSSPLFVFISQSLWPRSPLLVTSPADGQVSLPVLLQDETWIVWWERTKTPVPQQLRTAMQDTFVSQQSQMAGKQGLEAVWCSQGWNDQDQT